MNKYRNISAFELLGVFFPVCKRGGEDLEEFFSGNGVVSKLSKVKSTAPNPIPCTELVALGRVNN